MHWSRFTVIPEDWNSRSWGDLAVLEYGRSLRGYRQGAGSVKVFGTNGPIGWTGEEQGLGPTVIVGRKGAYRGVQYSPGPFWVIDTAFWLRPLIELDMMWAYYQLLTQDINGRDSGSAIPSLSRSDFSTLEAAVPPIHEQQAISAVLGSLDDKIDGNTVLGGLIEARLSAIFSAYSFDHPGDESQTLDQLIEVTPARAKPSQALAPYIDMAALPVDSALVDRADVRPPTSGSRFINGDTVMARITPCLENGKVAFIDCLSDSEVGVGSTEFIVLRPHESLPLQFAYFLARSDRFRNHAVRHMSGSSGRQRCPAEAIARYAIKRPDREALAAFADEAAPAFEMLRSYLNESILLRQIRDALLPHLVSGELRVRDIESDVEEIA